MENKNGNYKKLSIPVNNDLRHKIRDRILDVIKECSDDFYSGKIDEEFCLAVNVAISEVGLANTTFMLGFVPGKVFDKPHIVGTFKEILERVIRCLPDE